jgi:hypothetical protein
MTGSGVERTPRTAYPLPSVAPAGVSPLMPPHIQGAERRTERRVRTTGSRWGLRALVIGGLAGAAWLLTGTAAHAADRDAEPTGSLFGSVVDGDATMPVTGLLQAAVQPLETVRPAHQHHIVADILEVPHRVLSRPARTGDQVTHLPSGTIVDVARGDVDEILREIAGPLRLTDGPADLQLPVTRIPSRNTAKPVAEHPVTVPSRTGRPAAGRPAPVAPAVVEPQVPAVTPMDAVPATVPVPRTNRPRTMKTVPVLRAGHPHQHGKHAWTPHAHRRPAVTSVTADEPEAVQEGTNRGDGPAAPLRLHLGEASGTPISGSGTPTDGGCAAVLPAAITDSTMACEPLPIATDVEVRRHDAEAPTVSPD